MLLFLFFLHLTKYSQRNVKLSLYFFLLPCISSDFCLCIFVFLLLGVYDIYLCELYLLSLKIFIFVSFKNKFNLKKKKSHDFKKAGHHK